MQQEVWRSRAPGIIFGVLLIVWAVSEEPILGGGPGFGLAQTAVAAIGILSIILTFIWRTLLPHLISVTVSLLVALFFAEIFIGTEFAPKYATPFEYDPNLHYRLAPGAIRQYQHTSLNGGEKFNYVVNQDGFRGPPLEEKSSNRLRVVVYGDSFIHGEYSRYEETFVTQLGLALESRLARDIEVINAGVAGYGPDQALIKLNQELPLLKPDLIVMSVYAGNDFGDLVRNKLYRVNDRNELLVNNFKIPEETITSLKQSRQEPIVRKILRDWTSKWRQQKNKPVESAEVRMDRFLDQHVDEYKKYVIENDNVVGDLQEDPYSADISLLGEGASVEYKARLMQAVLHEMFDILAERSIPAVLIVIPHPIDASNGEHDSGHVLRSKYPDYDPSRLTDTATQAGEAAGFPVVNLFPVFSNSDPRKLYFLGGDDHWNAKGQEFAAKIVADYIQEQSIF